MARCGTCVIVHSFGIYFTKRPAKDIKIFVSHCGYCLSCVDRLTLVGFKVYDQIIILTSY